MLVISVDDRGPAIGKRAQDSRVLLGHFVHGTHELKVLALCVGDDCDRRPGDLRQVADFALVVHAQLDRAPAVHRPKAQERQRQSDVVVEIALRRKHVLVTRCRPQDAREHFLGRGLAVRTGHANEDGGELRAPVPRELAEREPGVLDHDQRQVDAGRIECPVDHRGRRAGSRDRGDELVAVELLAAQRHEQVALADRAAVGRHAGKFTVRAGGRSTQHPCRFGDAHHRWLQAAIDCSATTTSENGWRLPAISW